MLRSIDGHHLRGDPHKNRAGRRRRERSFLGRPRCRTSGGRCDRRICGPTPWPRQATPSSRVASGPPDIDCRARYHSGRWMIRWWSRFGWRELAGAGRTDSNRSCHLLVVSPDDKSGAHRLVDPKPAFLRESSSCGSRHEGRTNSLSLMSSNDLTIRCDISGTLSTRRSSSRRQCSGFFLGRWSNPAGIRGRDPLDQWEPGRGIEPLTYALQERCSAS